MKTTAFHGNLYSALPQHLSSWYQHTAVQFQLSAPHDLAQLREHHHPSTTSLLTLVYDTRGKPCDYSHSKWFCFGSLARFTKCGVGS
ncbi:uncharacterized protein LACBIDRAFT_315016 [Laccaria bicolor S238N-H82]|uniref:Predicted protein n=1 Tax=Laccaria bicolor (strain S238N-H82 / ATCC MYA-4686) TaxID=486041 RepID=B0DZK4_LACBS|nr:uncharacterized protein LACBIDRAFT_315016 [Laccaria bicolor S238N-H82]EDQ99953.1 predicted protein [Laccaria bicolor S238N-H82]|eukprot:XP_001889364.1 predicted protein [Laccaria bicolor S238N-H82]